MVIRTPGQIHTEKNMFWNRSRAIGRYIAAAGQHANENNNRHSTMIERPHISKGKAMNSTSSTCSESLRGRYRNSAVTSCLLWILYSGHPLVAQTASSPAQHGAPPS